MNEIARHWAETGEYPDGITDDDVQELSNYLYDQLDDVISTYIAETPLTQREAEIVALSRIADDQYGQITQLSDDAIALVLNTVDMRVGGIDDDREPTPKHADTFTPVAEHVAAAEKKIEAAEQTLGAVTFRNREEVLDSPQFAWLSASTIRRVRNQGQSDEQTFDEIVNRLVDETETRRSLEALVRGYLDARGEDNVAQINIPANDFENGLLMITAHTHVNDDLPDIVTETEAIAFRGHRYDFDFVEDPYGPQDEGRITLYASDNIVGMDAVALEDGLAAAGEHMRDLLDSDETVAARRLR